MRTKQNGPAVMILDRHPHCECALKAIGYWLSVDEPTLPNPADFVDASWDASEREAVACYLDSCTVLVHWMGLSSCRFCECLNGTSCLTDGTYAFPEGFSHYLREHGVRPPEEFVKHVLRRLEEQVRTG